MGFIMAERRRLLISFAHPDDESFGLGGLIARYVAEGVEVYLLCATNGDVGTVSDEYLNGYNSIAELRLAELDCAASKLGLKRVYKLGYKDSGMMGSQTNQDTACLWYRYQHQPEEVISRVVEVIRDVRPHVVITFNEYGGYGHPDHIAIQRATVAAFQLAGDANYVVAGTNPYAPQKLYYNSIPKLPLQIGVLLARLRGQDPRKLGRNHDIDLLAILAHVQPIHAKVDIHRYYDAWDAANACHASQGGGRASFLPLRLRRLLAPYQGFTRVYPAPNRPTVDEFDLFAGIRLDQAVMEC